ncbi:MULTISPECIES: putative bifunctional diguanylate cyclase/phosphodiesterase [Mesorhizobium]|nr:MULTISPECIES: EAL domain-containing protein [Mesorhizobium]
MQNDVLETRIVRDQLEDVRSGLWVSMPISAALSLLILAIEYSAGEGIRVLIWFVAVNLINGARIAIALRPIATVPENQLFHLKAFAFMSGICWSYLAVLTEGYTQPTSTFNLIILAGICAGAVTYSGSCALLSINFIGPPLITAALTLVWRATFESSALAFAVALFLVGLVRSSFMAEARFLELIRLRRKAELFAEEMERSSREDHLTGLLNRRGFEHALAAAKPSNQTFAAMAIDLDGFKSVNDTYGHRIGDDLLIELAQRAAAWAPGDAILARIGGDEFAIVHQLEPGKSLEHAKVQKLIDSITAPYSSAPSARIGACVGIYESKKLDAADMLLHSDVALYAAKAKGRNEFYFFDTELRHQLERRQHIERDLRAAIASSDLTSWFQPIVDLDTGRVAGIEALVRWTHPVHGTISPPEIITAAREIGALPVLTDMVFTNCCALMGRLNKSGRPEIKVAMNLSPLELDITEVDKLIIEGLRARGLSTAQFEIEITEESSLDYSRADKKLRTLAEAGVSIALDDFGTGFSTFASIKNGWITKIKIDKEFVSGSTSSLDDALLVKSVIDLGKALEIEVSAEGVETKENAKLLLSLGCVLAQGFLFSKPVSSSEILGTIERIETSKARLAS